MTQFTSPDVHQNRYLFLAGPFFNEEQCARSERLETECRLRDLPFYCARIHAARAGKDSPKELRQRIFKEDVRYLDRSGLVLANLDWAFPDNEIAVKLTAKEGTLLDMCDGYLTGNPVDISTIHIPDVGTMWEIGSAYTSGIDVIGYTTYPERPVNLMITESLNGFLRGWDEITSFLDGITIGRSVHYPMEQLSLDWAKGSV